MAAAPTATSPRFRVGITGRGWWFVASGLAILAAGVLLRWTPVAQLGALVALVPMVSALLTRGPRAGLALRRQLSSRELASGEQLTVSVGVGGHIPSGSSLLIEDAADPEIGGSHRFAIMGKAAPGESQAHYRVRVGVRGRHRIGPMLLHVIDRFGMVHRVVAAGDVDEVVVHPQVVRLDPRPLASAAVGTGSGHLGARGAATDDVIPREYHAGDEVRRIDWKASARIGDLMVRSEENPWRAAVTIVVDLLATSHRGAEPDSSVDAALSMTASIGCLALEQGWDLTVLTTDNTILFSGSPFTGVAFERRELLLALATAQCSNEVFPSPSLGYTTAGTAGPLVLVAGHMGDRQAQQLASIGAHTPNRVLVSVRADEWVPSAPGEGPDAGQPTGTTRPEVVDFNLAGWRQVELHRAAAGPGERGAAIADAWAGLARTR